MPAARPEHAERAPWREPETYILCWHARRTRSKCMRKTEHNGLARRTRSKCMRKTEHNGLAWRTRSKCMRKTAYIVPTRRHMARMYAKNSIHCAHRRRMARMYAKNSIHCAHRQAHGPNVCEKQHTLCSQAGLWPECMRKTAYIVPTCRRMAECMRIKRLRANGGRVTPGCLQSAISAPRY